MIPYYDVHGNLLTVQSRYLGDKTEEKPRFKFAPGSKPMVYGMQILPQVTEKEPLVITEDVPTAGALCLWVTRQ